MKVIFLDIDGVLNHSKTNTVKKSCIVGIDETCFNNFARIVKETDAKIVIISSWRNLWHNPDNKYANHLKGLFSENNIEVIHVCDTIDDDRVRDIDFILDKYKDEIESYVILDDDYRDIRPWQKDFHIITCYFDGTGLTEELANDAIKLLTPKWYNLEKLKEFRSGDDVYINSRGGYYLINSVEYDNDSKKWIIYTDFEDFEYEDKLFYSERPYKYEKHDYAPDAFKVEWDEDAKVILGYEEIVKDSILNYDGDIVATSGEFTVDNDCKYCSDPSFEQFGKYLDSDNISIVPNNYCIACGNKLNS